MSEEHGTNDQSADGGALTDEVVEIAAPTGPPSATALAEAAMAIEAIVLSSSDPAPSQLLAQMVELPVDVVIEICHRLAESYAAEGRGFQLAEVAGGWRYQTNPEAAPYVERFALEGQTARLSSAALETLSIVAYKQPISRAQVSAIRGVNVDGVLRTLVQRGYVDEVARDAGPGQAIMYGTTAQFLDRIGLASLKDLPSLGEFVPAASVVEALEHSLRVENEAGFASDDVEMASEDTASDDTVSDDTVSDDTVSAGIDLTDDAAEIDLTDDDVLAVDIDLTSGDEETPAAEIVDDTPSS